VPSHVALLRGINVGGRNKVAMSALRQVVASLGHSEVATYIQSGNVVFSSPLTDTGRLAADIEKAIAERMKVRPRVIVLSRDELAAVVADNPYPDEPHARRLHAVFRDAEPGPEALAALAAAQASAAARGGGDEARFVGRTLYLHTPDGYGRSELAAQLARRPATSAGTARNWATVTRLLGLLDG
jgi:uncharacterized protein (DUF1697 family)